jgi:hypothetical protein
MELFGLSSSSLLQAVNPMINDRNNHAFVFLISESLVLLFDGYNGARFAFLQEATMKSLYLQ